MSDELRLPDDKLSRAKRFPLAGYLTFVFLLVNTGILTTCHTHILFSAVIQLIFSWYLWYTIQLRTFRSLAVDSKDFFWVVVVTILIAFKSSVADPVHFFGSGFKKFGSVSG